MEKCFKGGEHAASFKKKSSTIDKRALRAHRKSIDRQNKRDDQLNKRRKMPAVLSPLVEIDQNKAGEDVRKKGEGETPKRKPRCETPRSKPRASKVSRREMLQKWKQEKDLKRKLDAKSKANKQPFKVSIVHHSVAEIKNNTNQKLSTTVIHQPKKNSSQAPVSRNPVKAVTKPEPVRRPSTRAAAKAANKAILTKGPTKKQKTAESKPKQEPEKEDTAQEPNIAGHSGLTSFAPVDFTFAAPSNLSPFEFKPLSPASAASFLFPSQEGGSYLTSSVTKRRCSTPKGQSVKRSSKVVHSPQPTIQSASEESADENTVPSQGVSKVTRTPQATDQRSQGMDTSLTKKETKTPLQFTFKTPLRASSKKLKSKNLTPEEKVAMICQSPMIEVRKKTPKEKTPTSEQQAPLPSFDDIDTVCAPVNLNSQLEATIVDIKPGGSSSGEHDVPYFRNLLTSETSRLTSLCKHWEEVNSSTPDIPEDARGQIRTTIGQAQLLMDQRFKQFSGLVDNCEYKTGEKETTCTDLQGFWDMVYFQVEDVNVKFSGLEKLQAKSWVEEKPEQVAKKEIPKKATKKSTKPVVKSKFAEFRAQMKAQQKQQQEQQVPVVVEPQEMKTFDAGFFKVNSPVKSPMQQGEGKSPRNMPGNSSPLLMSALSASRRPKVPSPLLKDTTSLLENNQPGDSSTTQQADREISAASPQLLSRSIANAPVVPSPLLLDITPGLRTRSSRRSRTSIGSRSTPGTQKTRRQSRRSVGTPLQKILTEDVSTPSSLRRSRRSVSKPVFDPDIEDKKEVIETDVSSVSSGEHDVPYFRNLLTSETSRLTSLCRHWEEVNSSTPDIPEDACGQIRTTIGQAQLLMDQRFKQFNGLVDNCEYKTGEKETTCTDLQGFWDMVYYQVEDVDAKFETLEKLQAKNWAEDKPLEVKNRKVQKKATKKSTKPVVKSKFAEFRAQMKAQQKQQQEQQVPVVVEPQEMKTFDAGFFKVNSPVKSPMLQGKSPRNIPGNSSPLLMSALSASRRPKVPSPLLKDTTSLRENNQPSDSSTTQQADRQISAASPQLLSRSIANVPVVPSPLLMDTTPGLRTRSSRRSRTSIGSRSTPGTQKTRRQSRRSVGTPLQKLVTTPGSLSRSRRSASLGVFTPDSLDKRATRKRRASEPLDGDGQSTSGRKSVKESRFAIDKEPEQKVQDQGINDADFAKFLMPTLAADNPQGHDESMEEEPGEADEEMAATMKRDLKSQFDQHSNSARKRRKSALARTPRSKRRSSLRHSVHFLDSPVRLHEAQSGHLPETPYNRNSLVAAPRVGSGKRLSSAPLPTVETAQLIVFTPPNGAEAKSGTPESATPATRIASLRLGLSPRPAEPLDLLTGDVFPSPPRRSSRLSSVNIGSPSLI
ncbi:uncharacterized protein LOC106169658 isoform X2 [Lingula anatina]|uniref:Uncharacterized protein LOC106169658 isoform X2 n=1 Tax=Lingula anatina TaxID=7574 RepID=A0A1S3J2N5_LINAN|nr:uncharacterized protein LOC106169658 isoform X2 [Lingula anatina]|eukprot:XP_013404677.1 uncharacterized protein LOC106169658 isoform X2 [Lingula anatina]